MARDEGREGKGGGKRGRREERGEVGNAIGKQRVGRRKIEGVIVVKMLMKEVMKEKR